MAVQTTEEFKNGGATSYTITIEYLQASDIKVRIGGTLQTYTTGTPGSGEYSVSGTTVTLGAAAPSGSGNVHIYRETDVNTAAATFAAGSSIRAADLNAIHDMGRFAAVEHRNKIITANIKAGAVTSTEIADDTIVNADINASAAIDNSKIADGLLKSGITVNSANIVDGSIVNDDINTSANIDGTKLADGTTPAAKLSTGALPTGVTVASANIVNGTIVDGDIATGTLDNRYYTETELNNGQLDNRYYTETELNAGQLDNRYYTETQLDAGQLDNRYYTETELNPAANAGANVLDARYYTETEAEARFLRQDSSETIASGQPWSNSDAFVATTAAINARIIDLVDEVGGFTVIATELLFPNSNPQGATGQSAIMSIGSLTQSYTPTGTTVTIANGTVGNSTVTITGVPSALPQGFGLLVESTSTLNTYTFHRLVPKATEVTTVASNITNISAAGANVVDINNFADLYQISGSAPTQRVDGTSLQDGDLWFDNTSNNLRVYDGTNWAIVTPAQSVLNDIAIVSGAITYQEDLGLISDAVTVGTSNGSLDIVADVLEDEATFTVTAATGKFIIDGVDKPALTLYKGWTYTFDVSDASNAAHPLRFHGNTAQFTTNVTVTGTQGQAGAKVSIKIPETQPTGFHYYCTNHSGMGNTITVKDDPIKTVSDNISNINTVASDLVESTSEIDTVANNITNVNAVGTNIANVNAVNSNETNINSVKNNETNINTVAGSITNVNSVASNMANVNNFTEKYQISGNDPSTDGGGNALAAGDLYFNTSANELKVYTGSQWQGGVTATGNFASVTGNTFTGDNTYNDSVKAKFGTGSDLQIYHQSNNSFINDTSSGYLFVQGDDIVIRSTGQENMIVGSANGSVDLYHGMSGSSAQKKFETTSTGATITGLMTATTIDGAAGDNLQLDFGTL